MIADYPIMATKEVIGYAPSSLDEERPSKLKWYRQIRGEGKFVGASNPVQFIQEVKNGTPNVELARRNETDMPEQIITQQIIKSRQVSIPTEKFDASQGASPLAGFGMYLGSLRRSKGLSIRDLASASNISIELAARIELGEASLHDVAECLPKVSEALGENVTKLSRLIVEVILE